MPSNRNERIQTVLGGQAVTKPQALDLLMLLSALESWSFSTGKPMPDYLLERLDVALAVLRDEVL